MTPACGGNVHAVRRPPAGKAMHAPAFACCSQDVLQLSGLQKATARLIEAVEIVHTSDKFDVNFVTIVPFFKARAGMRWDGRAGQDELDGPRRHERAAAAAAAAAAAVQAV